MAVTEDKAQHEPSMEEILSSIRRIISADGEDEPAADAANGRGAGHAPEARTARAPAKPVADDAETEVEDTLAAEDDDEEEVLELTDPAEPEPEPEPQPVEDEAPAAAPARPAPVRDAPVRDAPGLVSPGTAAASVTSLAQLADKLAATSPPEAFAGRTVEQLVVDLLRPMLREWLDQNLPGMVDTLVRAEIERLAGLVRR
ncbi:MAG TPA: DUF2497 domain-containing protein [Alphaproteobacteria bacterium]